MNVERKIFCKIFTFFINETAHRILRHFNLCGEEQNLMKNNKDRCSSSMLLRHLSSEIGMPLPTLRKERVTKMYPLESSQTKPNDFFPT